MLCQNCQFQNEPSAKFCGKCGKPLKIVDLFDYKPRSVWQVVAVVILYAITIPFLVNIGGYTPVKLILWLVLATTTAVLFLLRWHFRPNLLIVSLNLFNFMTQLLIVAILLFADARETFVAISLTSVALYILSWTFPIWGERLGIINKLNQMREKLLNNSFFMVLGLFCLVPVSLFLYGIIIELALGLGIMTFPLPNDDRVNGLFLGLMILTVSLMLSQYFSRSIWAEYKRLLETDV